MASVAVIERRRASLVFAQILLHSGAPDRVLSRVRVRVACVDADRFKPRAMPDGFLRVRAEQAGHPEQSLTDQK
jgi:acyl-CoA thioesterase FadM